MIVLFPRLRITAYADFPECFIPRVDYRSLFTDRYMVIVTYLANYVIQSMRDDKFNDNIE